MADENGQPQGYIEGRNITLFRSARVGEAMVAMFDQFHDQRYLDYAKHLADKYVELQRPDGSWPPPIASRPSSTSSPSWCWPRARITGLSLTARETARALQEVRSLRL